MIGPSIEITFDERGEELLARVQAMPLLLRRSIKEGLDQAGPLVVSKIQAERLLGEGPFPVEQHRLGQVTSKLTQSVYGAPAEIDGETVTKRFGSPIFYAGIHEFGLTYTRTSKPGKVRLRTDKRGELVKRGNLATFAGKRVKKQFREVPFKGGKTYTVTVPARHAFGFGLADSAPIMTRFILKRVQTNWEGGPQ